MRRKEPKKMKKHTLKRRPEYAEYADKKELSIIKQQLEIDELKSLVQDLELRLERFDKQAIIAQNLIENSVKDKRQLNEFRSSVVYPLYRLTSAFGNTSVGRLMQRLFK